MTATVPRRGLRARLRRTTRALAATLAAVTLASMGLVLPAAPATADATEGDDGEIALALAPAGGGVSRAAAPVPVTLVLTGDTAPLLDARAVLELGSVPIDGAEALASWLGAGSGGGDFAVIDSAPLPAPATGGALEIESTVGTADLIDLAAGVYPLRARLVGAAVDEAGPDLLEARSVIVATETPRPLTTLVPITLAPEDGALLTAEELAAATAADGVLTALVDALDGSSAVFAIDPSIPAAIRVLGPAAPLSATAWLDRLEALPNERFLLQFADADLTAQSQAGLAVPLLAPPLSSYADPDAAERLAPVTELGGIRAALPDLLWPRAGVLPGDLDTFAAYAGGPVTTVLPLTAVDGAASAVGDSAGHRLLLHEVSASAAASRAASEPDAVTRAAALARAAAHIALTAGDGPLLLALDRDDTRDGVALAETLRALALLGAPVRLTELQELPAAPVSVDTPGEEARAAALPALLADEQEIVAFSSILNEPAALTDRERLRLLRLLGVGEPAEGFAEAAAAHRERTRSILGSVGVVPPSDMHILSAAVDLPVWVRNELPWPVTVTLGARSADLRLDVQAETVVELTPHNNTRARIPVEARVASGEVDVHLSLRSPTGVIIGQPSIAHVLVRAEWERTGLIVLGGIVVLLLTFGVIRTVRRRRRADAAGDAGLDGDPADGADE